jgi:hypothetical protein
MFSRYIPFLALVAGLVSAQEQQRMMVHPLTDMPDAAADVTTSFYYPTYVIDCIFMKYLSLYYLCVFIYNFDFLICFKNIALFVSQCWKQHDAYWSDRYRVVPFF